jgi:hypothetical protein
MIAEETASQRMISKAPGHVCGSDALSTGYGALQHEQVELGSSRLQDGGEAHRARTADTHRAMVGLRVIALIADSTL